MKFHSPIYLVTVNTGYWNGDGICHQFPQRADNHGDQFESWRHFGRNGDGECQRFDGMLEALCGTVDQ